MTSKKRMLTLLYLFVGIIMNRGASGQVRYSIPEEMVVGSFVGNIAKDLGLDPVRLVSGRAQIFTAGNSEYVELDGEKAHLIIKERIDREQLCGETSACSFSFEVILENPMELFRVTIEILDINDNSPVFPRTEIKIEISEMAVPGARFSLESAVDADVGINSLQSYSLHPTDNFSLKRQSRPGGGKNVEMVLMVPLDREKQDHQYLTLSAVDGGNPKRSGTVKIHIVVLDANDNAPVFKQGVYRASVVENAVIGTLVTAVSATDADGETNNKVEYEFQHATSTIMELFTVDAFTGEIRLVGNLDFEKHKLYEIKIQAKDQGGLVDSADVIIDVLDVNDNAPKIKLMSFSNTVLEDAVPGTIIAMINVQDLDSEENSKVTCATDPNIPFKIESSLTNYYNLMTDSVLDRELTPEYNITITATDGGNPPLSSTQTLTVKIADVNDHPPQFEHESYNVYVTENNSPSVSLFSLKAHDADWGPNCRVSYFIADGALNGSPLTSYVSINADSGVLYAMRSFDYEKIKYFTIHVIAQDGGSPPLNSNISVNVFIQDQNDNAPQILYPVQTGVSLVAEIVPRSADVGYLVTKVVAVDVDSGQNAWLSFRLLKAMDKDLFEVDLQNGEIRTSRPVTNKDALKQKLYVAVMDSGQPPRSATVTVNVAVADSIPEMLSEFTEFTHDQDYNESLTFYLVLALAVVSFLFIVSIIAIVSVKFYRWRQSRLYYKSTANLPVIPYYPPFYADVGGTGTLQEVYNYRTADSRKSDFKDIRPCSHSVISLEASESQTLPHLRDKVGGENSENQVSVLVKTIY